MPVTLGFLALAIFFLWGPNMASLPPMGGVQIDRAQIEVRSREPLVGSPATTSIAGYDMRCSECHGIYVTPEDPPPKLSQHTNIQLNHGMNDRCLNCHSGRDREMLVLHGEKEVPFGEVLQLCAKCHGPTFRDWERGIHGRTNGFWDASAGEVSRLICTQCHDPHSPAFPGIAPLPGPHTLRMGDPRAPGVKHEEDNLNPLRRNHRNGSANGRGDEH